MFLNKYVRVEERKTRSATGQRRPGAPHLGSGAPSVAVLALLPPLPTTSAPIPDGRIRGWGSYLPHPHIHSTRCGGARPLLYAAEIYSRDTRRAFGGAAARAPSWALRRSCLEVYGAASRLRRANDDRSPSPGGSGRGENRTPKGFNPDGFQDRLTRQCPPFLRGTVYLTPEVVRSWARHPSGEVLLLPARPGAQGRLPKRGAGATLPPTLPGLARSP